MKKSKSILVNGKDFPLSPDRTEVLDILIGNYPNQTSFTRAEIKDVTDGYLPYWIKSSKYPFKEKVGNGVLFNLAQVLDGYNGGYSQGGDTVVPIPIKKEEVPAGVAVPATAAPMNMPVAAATSINLLDEGVKIIPEKMSNYVPFGHFKDVKNIIKSKIFFPVFVT
ncbi:uncharacterized protein METZ01_LOCUS282617, partial [marine metagenome]